MNEPDPVQQSTANHVSDPAEEKRVRPAEELEEQREVPTETTVERTEVSETPAERTETSETVTESPVTESDSNPSS